MTPRPIDVIELPADTTVEDAMTIVAEMYDAHAVQEWEKFLRKQGASVDPLTFDELTAVREEFVARHAVRKQEALAKVARRFRALASIH